MVKRVLSFFLITALLLMTLPAYAQNTNILEIFPSDGSTVYKHPGYFTVNPGGASEVVFELDGKYLGKADAYGRISAPDLAYGTHNLKVSAVVPGGTVICEESDFVYEKSTVVAFHKQDFDGYDGNVSNISDFYLVSEENADFRLVDGKSGKAGDMALSLTKKQALPYIQSKLFNSFNVGTTSIEFDIRFNSTEDTMRITSPYLWCEEIEVISGGKWRNTDVAISDNWTNVKITQDYQTRTVCLFIDGKTVVNNAPFMGDKTSKVLRFTCSTSDKASVKGGFTIDNLIAECMLPDTLLNRAVYYADGNEYPLEGEDAVPASAQKFGIYFEKELKTPDKSKVSLATSYGAKTEIASLNYDAEKKLVEIVPLSPLTPGREYVLTIDKSVALSNKTTLGNDCEFRFATEKSKAEATYSFTQNSQLITTASQIDYGAMLSADINVKNISSDTLTITYFLTLRKDGALHSIKATTVTLGGGEEQNLVISLPKLDEYYGEYELNLFNCTDFSDISAVEDFVSIR